MVLDLGSSEVKTTSAAVERLFTQAVSIQVYLWHHEATHSATELTAETDDMNL